MTAPNQSVSGLKILKWVLFTSRIPQKIGTFDLHLVGNRFDLALAPSATTPDIHTLSKYSMYRMPILLYLLVPVFESYLLRFHQTSS